MPIDVETEPGRTLAALAKVHADPARRARLELLESWYAGAPALGSDVPAAAKNAVREFHELASTGLAKLIVEATRMRQRITGIRTAADDDSTGDSAAFKLWLRARGPLVSADVHRLKGRFGAAYLLVSPPPPDEPDVPILTAEDPRDCVADLDPLRPWIARSGLKMVHDPIDGFSRAYLYRRGPKPGTSRLDVAEVETKSKTGVRFSPQSWSWNEQMSRDLPVDMPLIPFEALDGAGLYEHNLRLLRRIDFMVLQQLSIAVLQAFKQRAIKGVPSTDDKGNLIDYDKLFEAGPNALWLLPQTAEMWESGAVDLNGVGTAIRDYVRQLAAATFTPLSMLEASGENQSAEGAVSAKEGLIFKVEDANERDGLGHARAVEVLGSWVGVKFEQAQIIWAPPQRTSLAERAQALASAKAGDVPFRTRMIAFGGFDPSEVDRMELELAQERLDAQIAAAALQQQQVAAQPAVPTATSGQQQPAQNQPQDGPQAPQGGPNAAPTSNGTPAAPAGRQGGVSTSA